MDALLRQALTEVLRDLQNTSGPIPEVRDRPFDYDDDRATAMVYSAAGFGRGVSAYRHNTPAERLASVADQVQEWAVEALWTAARPATWPECPQHPDAHPLSAVARGGRAEWICPVSGRAVGEIGRLSARAVS